MTNINNKISVSQLAGYIDHTLLNPTATKDGIERLCHEAIEYGFHTVCINTRWIPLVAEILHDTQIKIDGVVSFPLGADSTKIKVAQAKEAIFAGADEIDMVADLASIIEGDAKYLARQLYEVNKVCHSMKPPVLLKVIIESAALNDEQIIFACRIAQEVGVDFIKTSTGLNAAGGATVEAVRLMKESAPKCKIKAAGGIKTAKVAIAMLEAGADRIGSSAAIKIIEEFKAMQEQNG
ncbi:MAG: deoxyribose-phosphate aldolase [Sedimentisphaerales bacterium]|nr:deoxyribose-phosphate aldolase [Sedimentisphaerales bacterium]